MGFVQRHSHHSCLEQWIESTTVDVATALNNHENFFQASANDTISLFPSQMGLSSRLQFGYSLQAAMYTLQVPLNTGTEEITFSASDDGTADGAGGDFNGLRVRIVDDLDPDGIVNATAVYNNLDTLTIHVKSNETSTPADIVAAINSLDAVFIKHHSVPARPLVAEPDNLVTNLAVAQSDSNPAVKSFLM